MSTFGLPEMSKGFKYNEMPDFSLSVLRSKFQAKNLEALYQRYEERYLLSNYGLYLTIQVLLSFAFVVLNIIQCTVMQCSVGKVYAADIVGHMMLAILSGIIFIFLHREEVKRIKKYEQKKDIVQENNQQRTDQTNEGDSILKRKPNLLYILAILSAIAIEVVDLSMIIVTTMEDFEEKDMEEGEGNSAMLTNRGVMAMFAREELGQNGNHSVQELTRIPHKVPVMSLFNVMYVYLFFPISRKDIALSFGFFISIFSITTSTVATVLIDRKYGVIEEAEVLKELMVDIIFHIALNFVGWYFRYVAEINMRRGFLDKRGCIETTLRLKYEKEQMDKLCRSIMPDHIAPQVQEGIQQYLKNLSVDENKSRMPYRELYIHKYENVSILFADICNFTPLTTTLSPQQLVETLNDLFGKFDDATKEHNCLRIKILGDCYYCVSGIPDRDDQHAHNTVRMGLDMIHLITEVRMEHRVNVNMRIGIHSGYILSGVIGTLKWQFDIWSRDVVIANHMETTGEPGKVHITSQTKSYLGDDFHCTPSRRENDPVLTERGLTSYLISPPSPPQELTVETELHNNTRPMDSPTDLDDNTFLSVNMVPGEDRKDHFTKTSPTRSARRVSIATPKLTSGERTPRSKSRSNSAWSDIEVKKKKSVLMDSSIRSFMTLMEGTEQYMEEAIEKLPLRVIDRWLVPRDPGAVTISTEKRLSTDLNPFFLYFSNRSWNSEYLKESDLLFKHYIMSSFIILNVMGILLIITSYNTTPHVLLWLVYVILFMVLVFLLPCTWISYIWDQIIDPEFELEYITAPDNTIINFFYQASGRINTRPVLRIVIFLFVALMIVTSSILDVAIHPCLLEKPRNYTYRSALSIMAIFMFLRIYTLLKLLLSGTCLLIFGLIIGGFIGHANVKTFFGTESFGYEHWLNDSMKNWSHFMYILGVFLYFLLSDRQSEYINRLDYMWKRTLKTDQEEAEITKLLNKVLLQNILPKHVADIYLSNDREAGQLYSESYQDVAVMFASIPMYIDFFSEAEISKSGETPLKVLNEIICTFDKLMVDNVKVEKIKIISSTLLVASGLEPGSGLKDSPGSENNSLSRGGNAAVLVNFAIAMMKKLAELDYSKFGLGTSPNFQLRIGIHAGPVIAGVVGAQKPLYDIWGDTVNVASRMDYTGSCGEIHLPKSTADEIISFDNRFNFRHREEIYVKGKGKMQTCFVDCTEVFPINNPKGIEMETLHSSPAVTDIKVSRKLSCNKLTKIEEDVSEFKEIIHKMETGGISETPKMLPEIESPGNDLAKERFPDHKISQDHPENHINDSNESSAVAVETEEIHMKHELGEAPNPDNSENKDETIKIKEEIEDPNVNGETGDELMTRDSMVLSQEDFQRMDEKKDSGYGSQGMIRSQAQNVAMEADEASFENEGVSSRRSYLKQLPKHKLSEHYEVFETSEDF